MIYALVLFILAITLVTWLIRLTLFGVLMAAVCAAAIIALVIL